MQPRWKGAAALVAIGAAVGGALGAAFGLRYRSADREGTSKLPPSSGGGTSTAGPLGSSAAVDAPVASPTPEEVPRHPVLSDEFRALSNGKKVLAYFGFLDVEVYKHSAPLFRDDEEAEIFGR